MMGALYGVIYHALCGTNLMVKKDTNHQDGAICEDGHSAVEELEEKIAWLEAQLDAQGAELKNLQDSLLKMQRAFRMLASRMEDPYATRSESDEVPPPHY